GRRHPRLCGGARGKTPQAAETFGPGEIVQVRSKAQVMATVDAKLLNRGLSFDVEMAPYCEDGPHRVLRRVEKIVDERTGRLIQIKNPCLILDEVVCSGKLSSNRMFCPRALYPFWRDVWLERAGTENP